MYRVIGAGGAQFDRSSPDKNNGYVPEPTSGYAGQYLIKVGYDTGVCKYILGSDFFFFFFFFFFLIYPCQETGR